MVKQGTVGFIIRQEFVRSFIDQGIMENLNHHLNLRVVTTSSNTVIPSSLNHALTLSPIKSHSLNVASFEHEVLSRSNRALSSSIRFRLKYLYPNLSTLIRVHRGNISQFTSAKATDAKINSGHNSKQSSRPQLAFVSQSFRLALKVVLGVGRWALRSFLRRPLAILLSHKYFLPTVRFCLDAYLNRQALAIARELDNLKLDLLVIPSGGLDPLVSQLIRASRTLNTPVFLLADNWDQMGSKGAFPHKPEFIGLVGTQSRDHAVHIQGFDPRSAVVLGSSTYSHYTPSIIDSADSSMAVKPYILFLGSSLPFDERKALLTLQVALDGFDKSLQDMEIVYKPHPLRVDTAAVQIDEFRRVRLDDQYLAARDSNIVESRGIGSAFSLDHYPRLLREASLVVSSPTSMLLEASILHKRIVLLGYKEPGNETAPGDLLENFVHMHGVERMENVSICNNLSVLGDLVRGELLGQTEPKMAELPIDLSYFIEMPPHEYPSRLLNALNSAMG